MAQDRASSSGQDQNDAQQGQSGARQGQPGSQETASQQRSDMNQSATGAAGVGRALRRAAGGRPAGRDWDVQSTGSDASTQRQAAGQDDVSL